MEDQPMATAYTWYSARLIFVAWVDEQLRDDALLEVSIRVFRARNNAEAVTRAAALGRACEHTYLNADQQTVAWRFAGFLDLQCLVEETIEDGTEVFSRLEWRNHIEPEVAELVR